MKLDPDELDAIADRLQDIKQKAIEDAKQLVNDLVDSVDQIIADLRDGAETLRADETDHVDEDNVSYMYENQLPDDDLPFL